MGSSKSGAGKSGAGKSRSDETGAGKSGAGAKTGRAIFGAFFTALILKAFVFDFMIAEGQSMTPAIPSGSVLLVSRLAYGLRLPWTDRYLVRWAEPHVGEVIVFYTPQGSTAVKRCAVLTGRDTFIALGDNGAASLDSRSYGPVSFDHIIGKVLGK
jgi:signal peptidase I